MFICFDPAGAANPEIELDVTAALCPKTTDMSAVKGASVSLYSLHPGLCVTDLVIQKQAASLMGHDSSFPALPTEVLDVVASYISADDQESLHAFCSVSRSWYSGGVEHLYRFPKITGRNFDLFIRSICPSVNLHVRQNGLADLIRVLDMSHLVYNGSKSLTARLLNRVKNKLEVFVAPTATFGYVQRFILNPSELDIKLTSLFSFQCQLFGSHCQVRTTSRT